jgi:hypothetical protein
MFLVALADWDDYLERELDANTNYHWNRIQESWKDTKGIVVWLNDSLLLIICDKSLSMVLIVSM